MSRPAAADGGMNLTTILTRPGERVEYYTRGGSYATAVVDRYWAVFTDDGVAVGQISYTMLTREHKTPGRRFVNRRWKSPGYRFRTEKFESQFGGWREPLTNSKAACLRHIVWSLEQ